MLLERFHNKIHGSRLSRHSGSKSGVKASESGKRAEDRGKEVAATSMDESAATGPASPASPASTGISELQINTQVCNTRAFAQNGVSTPVMTPIMTPTTQPIMPYMYGNQGRQDSVVSFASSISDMPGPSRTAGTPAVTTFSAQFVRVLMDVYQDISSDPTATPFDTANPPSGILNRTAKVAVERAEQKGVDLGREKNALLVNCVRQRLLQELRRDAYMSRNSSLVSLPPMPQFHASELGTAPVTCSDYFGCIHSEIPTHQHSQQQQQQQPLSAPFQVTASVQQPLHSPFEHRCHHYAKPIQRSRNDSFISAVGRSRSGSNHVFPFQQSLQSQQLQAPSSVLQPSSLMEPSFNRPGPDSNGYFVLTPTSSGIHDWPQPMLARERSDASSIFEDMMSVDLPPHRKDSVRYEKGSMGSLSMDF